jgi:hypothetical protein
MRTPKFNRVAGVLLFSVWMSAQIIPAAAADGDPYLGKWNGTYQGDNTSGHFELTLARGGDGSLTGSIAVSGDGGGASDYTVKLKSAVFAGDSFTASYDSPGDDQTEIRMKGTFNPKGADGDWSVNPKAQPGAQPVATGTWKVSKP